MPPKKNSDDAKKPRTRGRSATGQGRGKPAAPQSTEERFPATGNISEKQLPAADADAVPQPARGRRERAAPKRVAPARGRRSRQQESPDQPLAVLVDGQDFPASDDSINEQQEAIVAGPVAESDVNLSAVELPFGAGLIETGLPTRSHSIRSRQESARMPSRPAAIEPPRPLADETPETVRVDGPQHSGPEALDGTPADGPGGRRRSRRGGRKHRARQERAAARAAEAATHGEPRTLKPPRREPVERAHTGAPPVELVPESVSDAPVDEITERDHADQSPRVPDKRGRGRDRDRGRRGVRRVGRQRELDEPLERDAMEDLSEVEEIAPPEEIGEDEDGTVEEVPDGAVQLKPADLRRRCKREMVINVSGDTEVRIAVLHESRLEELFIERSSAQSHVGNIYKGRVTNVEASIQAAFIDFGLPKHGFLHISDVQPQYFPNHNGEAEEVGRKIPRHHRPPIQKCFRRGQEVIVQITKEGVGTKGPTLSTYLSIPGRFLVMMPGMNRHGVSRKIEDEQSRRQMKDLLNDLEFPPGMGFILRTAGMDRSKRELQRDLNYLTRLWKRVVERVKKMPSPAELYRESDLVTRTIRDVYTSDFERLVIDNEEAGHKAAEFLHIAMPRSKPQVEIYKEPTPLFHRLGIEQEIERIHARHVPLSSGGSLVIDSTEAMVAIDVNSGRFRSPDDAEETALRINMEASDEIARQLRLRDLGGLIVCDFIDMRLDRNRRKVERSLRDALKKHKERARILRMSAFGLIEMTRQRQGPSLKRNIYFDCPHCRGSGLVKMPESVMLDVMRQVQLAAHQEKVRKVTVTVASDMAYQILNSQRSAVSKIEQDTGVAVSILGDPRFTSDQIECVCEDGRGHPVAVGA